MTTLYPQDYDPTGGAAVAAAFLILALFWFFFAVIYYVLSSLFFMKIFEKAGVQGKWRAWVPFYNHLIFVKLGDLNPWWLLILWGGAIILSGIPVIGFIGSLAGIAGFVYTMLAAWRVGLKLQKEAVWLILYFFLSLVWLGINAYDKSRWNTAIPPAPWAGNFLADNTVWSGIPVQTPAGGYPANPVTQPGAYPPAPGAYPPPPAAATPPAAPTPPPTTQPPAGPVEPPAPPAPPTTEPPAPPSDPDAPRA